MIVAILIEMVTFISAIATSYIYEGKALLKLGEENYRIRIGKLESYDKDLEQNLFPPLYKEKKNLNFYLDFILSFIPGLNILCSHIKGKKRYKNIVDDLMNKGIIIPMTEEEIIAYTNSENVLEKIYYLVFEAMDSSKSTDADLENVGNVIDLEEVEISEEIKKEAYERDISYMEAMISFESTEEKPKQKKKRKNTIYRRS